VKELRGPAGTPAELTIRRAGIDKAITYKLTRATIHIRSVDPRITMMLDDRVGYIALSPVSESSTRDVAQAIDTLLKQGMKSLIFDLRGNPVGCWIKASRYRISSSIPASDRRDARARARFIA